MNLQNWLYYNKKVEENCLELLDVHPEYLNINEITDILKNIMKLSVNEDPEEHEIFHLKINKFKSGLAGLYSIIEIGLESDSITIAEFKLQSPEYLFKTLKENSIFITSYRLSYKYMPVGFIYKKETGDTKLYIPRDIEPLQLSKNFFIPYGVSNVQIENKKPYIVYLEKKPD